MRKVSLFIPAGPTDKAKARETTRNHGLLVVNHVLREPGFVTFFTESCPQYHESCTRV